MNSYSGLRAFNNEGLDIFENVFCGQIDASTLDPIEPTLTSYVKDTKAFAVREFANAKEMAECVLFAIGNADLSRLLDHTGLWAWLTFVMRDQLFKKTIDGKWRVGEVHRWYPSSPNDWLKGQRHLVRMPVLLLETLDKDADHLLCNHPSLLPEIREQLTSQQDMFNSAFQKVARALYFDDDSGSLKRGAGGKGAGSPRRLAKVRQQLDVTWDLESLDHRRIIKMLPGEFARFTR